jgi:DNA helicase-2/ATP-dependent DNA helicase PcrA
MLIDGWKNRGLTPEQVPSGEAATFANGKGKKLYMAYQERLKTLNAADFGDLLLENIRLFRTNPDVLRSFQERFKFILVDEYQDTNVAQYLWLKLLAQTTSGAPASGLILRDAALRAAPQDEEEGGAPLRAPENEENASAALSPSSPGRSPAVIPGRGEAADPESSATAEPLDSGFALSARPGMTNENAAGRGMTEENSARAPTTPHPEERGRSPSVSKDEAKTAQPEPPHRHPKNICCVGDDDQSIYGWRGAEVDNILRFDHDFPGAKVIRLERNYRSTGHILAAASHLIAHNEGRLGKTLRTEDELGEKVQVTGGWDSEEEARAIGEEIEQLQRAAREQGLDHPLDEIAILVRASFQMREFEDRFIQLGLPYRVIGGPRFYERAEIRDALAYLRVIAQPADDLAFERIVNVPKRGLGDATVQMLHDYARKKRIPLTEAASALSATDEMKPKPRMALRDLMASFERWRAKKDSMPHTELAEIVLDESGYTDMWQKDRSADAAGRLENLKELVRSMEEFENLQGFLEHISLVMDREGAEAEQAVNIMTLHSAKGLEFDCVFLPGWEEGLFPHQRSLDESGRAGLEEERRLAHVGLTRARKLAKIYFATNRRIHGLWTSTVPSRFLDELPEAHVEVKEAAGGSGGFGMSGYGASRFDEMSSFGSSYSTPGWQRAQQRKGKGGFYDNGQPRYVPDGVFDEGDEAGDGEQARPEKIKRGSAKRDSGRKPLVIEGELVAKSTGTTSSFTVGERVFHQKFGNGNVVAVDGNKLTIAFDHAGEKRVVDSFVDRV